MKKWYDIDKLTIIENKLYDYTKMKNKIKRLEDNLYSDFGFHIYSKYKKGYQIEDKLVEILDRKESLKKWQELINKVLVYFFDKKPKYYQFIKYKYFSKKNVEEIESILNINFEEQEEIRKVILDMICENAKLNNLF